MELNDEQRYFCSLENERIRLLAPAGSGKTLSLLYRCKYLYDNAEQGKPRFLIFAFTKVACEELNNRLKTDPTFKDVKQCVRVQTLNAWGLQQIRNFDNITSPRMITKPSDRYFCMQNFLQPIWKKYTTIKNLLENQYSKSKYGEAIFLLFDQLKEMGFNHNDYIDCDCNSLEGFEYFKSHIDFLHDCGLSTYFSFFMRKLYELSIIDDESSYEQAYINFIPFWGEASIAMYKSSMFTYADQKYWAYNNLEKQLQKGTSWTGAARYHHIFVDEFQDINPLDLRLLKVITMLNKASLVIIGDDDQAIYEFRGASPSFIINPEKFIAGDFETILLRENYRSPKNIVEHSQKLIANNSNRVPKTVSASSKEFAVIEIKQFQTIYDTINGIVKLVCELRNTTGISKIALISRKRSQLLPYQIVFAGQDIPYYTSDDLHIFFSNAFDELKNLIEIRAKLSHGYRADIIKNILDLCDKVKSRPLSKIDKNELKKYLHSKPNSTPDEIVAALRSYRGKLKGIDNKDGKMSILFADSINAFFRAHSVSETLEVLNRYFEGLQKNYGKSLEDVFYTDPPFFHLVELAERYNDDFSRFYEEIEKAIALASTSPHDEDDGTDDSIESEYIQRTLHLITSLRAKGKEYDAVIILDTNDGIWPSKLAKTEEQIEEERRIFYVAVTRARKRLYFAYSDHVLNKDELVSPYLKEMGM